MDLEALIFSGDTNIVRMLSMLLGDLAIRSAHCNGERMAAELVMRRKFDAIFVDFAHEQAAEVLTSVRHSPANKRSLVFALLDESLTIASAFQLGANFVIYKPLTLERARRSLRAAHGLMMRERRKHFRFAVPPSVYAELGRDQSRAVVEDVSAGGMALRTVWLKRPQRKQQLHLRFNLPGVTKAIDAAGEIVWADPYGRTGIRFLDFRNGSREDLEQWCIHTAVLARNPSGQESRRAQPPAAERWPAAMLHRR